MNDENENVIVASNLKKTFTLSRKQRLTHNGQKEKIAVNNLSFEVKRGEIFGLLGPHGAGKTTTLRMLAGLVAPDKGKILIDRKESTTNSREIRSSIGFLTSETLRGQEL